MKKLILSACIILTFSTSRAQEVQVMDLKDLTSRIYNESDTTYIVNFWATWCAPCIQELPYFEQFNASLTDEDAVKVLLVSLDFSGAREKRLIPFLKEQNIRSEVIHFLEGSPPNDWIPKISEVWTGAIPATLVVNNATGTTTFHERSFHSVYEIRDLLK